MQPAERFGLTVMIGSQADMEVVAQTGCMEDAMELLSAHHPDIALIDSTLFDGGTATGFRQCGCRILLLAMYEGDERVGVDGYVLKGAAHGELLQAIRRVHGMGDGAYPPAALMAAGG